MARLWRPSIPLEVKCRVALRQLGEMWPDAVIKARRWKAGDSYMKGIGASTSGRGLGKLLDELLGKLAELLGCSIEDLRLDHQPALALRPQFKRGLGKKTYYEPDANDPEFLFYRPHGSQFAGSHDIKTRIRGDNGQYSDVQLIKRQRKRERPPKPKRKWAARPFPKGQRKIQSRPFN